MAMTGDGGAFLDGTPSPLFYDEERERSTPDWFRVVTLNEAIRRAADLLERSGLAWGQSIDRPVIFRILTDGGFHVVLAPRVRAFLARETN